MIFNFEVNILIMNINPKVLERAASDKVLIAKISTIVNKDYQTVKKWLSEPKNLMNTLHGVYSTIQGEYSLSDKEMFTKK